MKVSEKLSLLLAVFAGPSLAQGTVLAAETVPSAAAPPTAGAAAQAAPDSSSPPPAAPDPFGLELHGVASVWGLNQRNFFLGKDVPLNEGDHVVQNFQFTLKAGRKAIGAQLRLDAAQGWWGVDNDPNTQQSFSLDENGVPINTVSYNSDTLFGHKDTNYPVHLDHAFIYFQVPSVPLKLQVGRQYFGIGNKLVLDMNYEGIVAQLKPMSGLELQGFWAKVSEGKDSYKAPTTALLNDTDSGADANLFGLSAAWKPGSHRTELFGLYYQDPLTDWSYFPQGLGYSYSRFQPQVSQAIAAGAIFSGSFEFLKGLEYSLEADYLWGRDAVANTDYAGNLLDQNDGTLMGYNAYLMLNQKLPTGIPLELGLVMGMGSGDPDPSSGPGNLNRIQTMGFFGLTHVWEDSIMTDQEGISPQGLGSPASRGYRELQNTTVAMLKLGANPWDAVRLELAYAYLRATQPVTGWDAAGPTDASAQDIGQELDADLTVRIWKELSYRAQLGYFMPGEATALLINGTTEFMQPALELRQMLTYRF